MVKTHLYNDQTTMTIAVRDKRKKEQSFMNYMILSYKYPEMTTRHLKILQITKENQIRLQVLPTRRVLAYIEYPNSKTYHHRKESKR